jgi:hypothetical protein
MAWTIALILVLIWALVMLSTFSFGGYIHLLLLAAAGIVAFRLLQRRQASR